jgi:hypothetical protein
MVTASAHGVAQSRTGSAVPMPVRFDPRVLRRVLMASGTVCLAPVGVPPAAGVFADRGRFRMGRVHTSTVETGPTTRTRSVTRMAQMVEREALEDRADEQLVGESVRRCRAILRCASTEGAIAVAVERAEPGPAPILSPPVDLRPEPLDGVTGLALGHHKRVPAELPSLVVRIAPSPRSVRSRASWDRALVDRLATDRRIGSSSPCVVVLRAQAPCTQHSGTRMY